MKKLLALLALLVIAAGCIEPVVKLGCCRKECILEGGYGCKIGADEKLKVCAETDTGCEKGCFLYNTTDFKDYNYAAYTKGQCDKAAETEDQVDTTGLCNVSVGVLDTRQDFLIPICSEDDIVKCIEGNCTAMVCGDFVFKPRTAPGFQENAGDPEAGAEGQSGSVPADSDEDTVMQFYKGQCRFLPMDGKLRSIMKNSKSQINVFRVGVGGSFDEYDQYRYYFPISDKYCNINQPDTPGQIMVDRYMNYLTTDSQGRSVAYNDPIGGITENCVDGTDDPAVLAFHERGVQNTSTLPSPGITSFQYYPVLPEANNYKFAHHAIVSIFPTLNLYEYGGYVRRLQFYAFYSDIASQRNVSVAKKIDEGYYRRELSIAHAADIYDTAGRGTTRATFECNYEGSDCYSGTCSTQKYSRSVMLKYVGGDNPASAPEVVTDCNAYTDDAGMSKVVCAPTKSITLQPGKAPKREYGRVVITPVMLQYHADGNYKDVPVGAGDLTEEDALDSYWSNFYSYSDTGDFTGSKGMSGITRTVTNATTVEWSPITLKKDCTWESYDASVGDNDRVWCDHVTEASTGPPLGGITFFGKIGDNTVRYPAVDASGNPVTTGKPVIGWSNLRPEDFTQTLLYKNCGLTSNDYEVVYLYGMDDSTGSTMAGLLASFKRYFQARVQGLKGGIASASPNKANKYSIIYSSMPWVPVFERGVRRVHYDDDDCSECSPGWNHYRHLLSAPPPQSIRDRNIYDEDMNWMPGTSGSSLVAADGSWNGDERDDDDKDKRVYSTYALGLSRYLILIHYTPASMKLGNCAIDDTTYLPRVRTFGWCEPCTTSTLAFQNISSNNVPPGYATTECDTLKDEFNEDKLVCQKKELLAATTAPDRVYARVEAIPYHFELHAGFDSPVTRAQAKGAIPLAAWDAGTSAMFNVSKGKENRTVNTTNRVMFDYIQRKQCTWDYGTNTDSTKVLCSFMKKSHKLPPVGGAVFFGKTEKSGAAARTNVRYDGSTIIGYALATPNDFSELAIVKACQLTENDYVEVELSEPGGQNWQALTTAFRPYFQQRMEKVSDGWLTGCTASSVRLQPYDLVVSSMPWVFDYEKGTVDNIPGIWFIAPRTVFSTKANHLSSTAAQAFRKATPANTESMRGTGTCDLHASAISGLAPTKQIYYNLAFSRYVYLFKYTPGSGKLGSCKVDEATFLPKQREFCTAYEGTGYSYEGTGYYYTQECTAYDEVTDVAVTDPLKRSVYMPSYTANVEGPASKSQLGICTASGYEGAIACSNKYITDVDEYNGVATTTGAPRTNPDAAIVKERIGNYLKSGVMPVIDLSDGTNWGRINPKGDLLDGSGTPWFLRDSATRLYTEYDFERLFGDMGAVLVIVSHVNGPADADKKLETIIDRSGVVRDKCLTCLIAVHVDSPASNNTFAETVGTMMSDPRANMNVDMITFDYTVSRHPPPATLVGLGNKSKAVVEDIASYGSASLAAGGKPTMVVGFNVYSNDTLWNGNYATLFDTIVEKQGLLVRSGVSGIIYSPARTLDLGPKPAPTGTPFVDLYNDILYGVYGPNSGKGIVTVPLSTAVGSKTPKFCALQGALQKMSSNPPVAVFKRLPTKDVQCVACTSIDYASGFCSLAGGTDQRRCSDGRQCTLPTGLSAGQAKCPEEVVTDGCPMCTASGKAYECTYTHTNGTVEVTHGNIRDLDSDIYSDVIAGLPEPYRCCVGNETLKYSFSKQSYRTAINKPVVFPKIGGEGVDCGMGGDTLDDLSGLSGFCGYQLPLELYDIECRITGDAPPPAAEPCTDTDGGNDEYTFGRAREPADAATGGAWQDDYCEDGESGMEYYCSGGHIQSSAFICPSGFTCVAGACTAD